MAAIGVGLIGSVGHVNRGSRKSRFGATWNQRKIRVGVTVPIRIAAAVHDHRIVQQGVAVEIFGLLEFLQELRELLRVFFLTASALTTLMAFGGTFRPLTKQGIDVRELLVIVMNMMPLTAAIEVSTARPLQAGRGKRA